MKRRESLPTDISLHTVRQIHAKRTWIYNDLIYLFSCGPRFWDDVRGIFAHQRSGRQCRTRYCRNEGRTSRLFHGLCRDVLRNNPVAHFLGCHYFRCIEPKKMAQSGICVGVTFYRFMFGENLINLFWFAEFTTIFSILDPVEWEETLLGVRNTNVHRIIRVSIPSVPSIRRPISKGTFVSKMLKASAKRWSPSSSGRTEFHSRSFVHLIYFVTLEALFKLNV